MRTKIRRAAILAQCLQEGLVRAHLHFYNLEMRLRERGVSIMMAVAAIDPSWLTAIPGQNFAVGIDSTNYLFPKTSIPNQSFNSVQAQVSLKNSSERIRLGGQAQAMYTVGTALPFNFEVNEAYVGSARSFSWGELTLGRKLKPWSELDETWKLGIWQPRFFFDPLQATSSGLIGLFYDTKIGDLEINVLASGLSMPEHGLLTSFENGRVISPSRWFRVVPESVAMMGATIPIQYTLTPPDILKVLFNPTAAVRLRYGAGQGFWGAASYGYKPNNQIVVGMDGVLDINSSLQVTLNPRTLMHHVATLEAGFQSREWSATFSMLGEVPVRDVTPVTWTTQELQPSLAAGPMLRWSPQGVGRAPRVLAGYMLQAGGDASDQGPLANPALSNFDPRYFFQNALLLDGETDIASQWTKSFLGAQLLTRGKVIVDLVHGSVLLSPQIALRFKDAVSVGLGADVFATASRDYATAGFLGQSVQNSRFFGRVSYGF